MLAVGIKALLIKISLHCIEKSPTSTVPEFIREREKTSGARRMRKSVKPRNKL